MSRVASINTRVARDYVRAAERSPAVWDTLKAIYDDESLGYKRLSELRGKLQTAMENHALRVLRRIDRLQPTESDRRVAATYAAQEVGKSLRHPRPAEEVSSKPVKTKGPKEENRRKERPLDIELEPATVQSALAPTSIADLKLTQADQQAVHLDALELFNVYLEQEAKLAALAAAVEKSKSDIVDFANRHGLWVVVGTEGRPTYSRSFKIRSASEILYGVVQSPNYSQEEASVLLVSNKLKRAGIPRSLTTGAPRIASVLQMVRNGDKKATRLYDSFIGDGLWHQSLSTTVNLYEPDGTLIRKREQGKPGDSATISP